MCNFRAIDNAAAVLEWAVAFIFTFYVLSFFIDLLPAVHTKNYASRTTAMQMEANDAEAQGVDHSHNEAAYYGQGNSSQHAFANGYAMDGVNGGGHANGSGRPAARVNGETFMVNGVHYVQGPNGPVAKTGVESNF